MSELTSFLKKNKKIRLSPTSLSTYNQCQRQFFYTYIRGIKPKPTPAMVRGRITHKVLEHFFNYVNLVDLQEENWEKLWQNFRNILTSLLKTEWKQIGKEYVDCFKDEKQKSELFDETKRFLNFYAAKLAFSLSNKILELNRNSNMFEQNIKRFFYPRDREVRIDLEDEGFAGIIDKTMSLFGKGIAIVDYKTSKSPLPHFIPEGHLKQGKAYAYLWKESFGELPKHISFYYLRSGESVYYPISENDVQEIVNDIKEIREKEPVLGKFHKNPTKLCGYCDFFKFCFGDKTLNEVLKKKK